MGLRRVDKVMAYQLYKLSSVVYFLSYKGPETTLSWVVFNELSYV